MGDVPDPVAVDLQSPQAGHAGEGRVVLHLRDVVVPHIEALQVVEVLQTLGQRHQLVVTDIQN